MKYKKSKRGQIVVFMVLIFQMLFVFIAMVVNIGLVVHDKINLQNSVDLAAIYGAQRQAEILNALAHINYQIRQSYKLMAWRYFILGSLGSNHRKTPINRTPPYDITNRGFSDGQNCTSLRDICSEGSCSRANRANCPYAVCMVHPQWKTKGVLVADDDHLCQRVRSGSSPIQRPQFSVPAGLGPVIGEEQEKRAIERANLSLDKACKGMKTLNWIMASSFLYSFRYDQWKRKILAMELFDQLLNQSKDIEGKKIEDGIKKTLKNNLTFVNYINFDDPNHYFDFKNSVSGKKFEDYFQWEQIAPILFYIKQDSPDGPDGEGVCDSYFLPIFHSPDCDPNKLPCDHHLYDSSQATIEKVNNTILNARDPIHLSSGFYKVTSPSVIHTKVEVAINYSRQIFFPMNQIILRAEAYAKPFGSGFGPPPRTDERLPTGSLPALPNNGGADLYLTLGGGSLLDLAPNHSLYPGDQNGLLSFNVQQYWTKQLTSGRSATPAAVQNKGNQSMNYIKTDISREHDPMVIHTSSSSNFADPKFLNVQIRKFEEIAIAPDLFDLTYYTILPNYMTTLYRKMVSNVEFRDSVSQKIHSLPIPGDLGFFYTEGKSLPDFRDLAKPLCYSNGKKFRLNFIQKQVECSRDTPDFLNKVENLDHLLTSWAPPLEGGYRGGKMYDLSNTGNPFGDCTKQDSDINISSGGFHEGGYSYNDIKIKEQNLIPQHCLRGGRSGFSVKLIHGDMAN